MKILVDQDTLRLLLTAIKVGPELPYHVRYHADLLARDLEDGETISQFVANNPGCIEKKSRGGRPRKDRS